MGNSESSGCASVLGGISMLLSVLLPLFIGYKTWQYIDPDGFGGVLLFVAVWGALSAVITPLVCGLIAMIASSLNE